MQGKTDAALWSKLKSAGPVDVFDMELQRFRPWLPAELIPVMTTLIRSRTLMSRCIEAEERCRLERACLQQMKRQLIAVEHREFLETAIGKLEQWQAESLLLRQQSLAAMAIDVDFDRHQMLLWQQWLASHGRQMPMAVLLMRLSEAWLKGH